MGRHTQLLIAIAMQPVLLFSFLASALSVPLDQELTPSWVEACGGTYLFSEDKKSWTNAYGECEFYGSHIAQIHGLEENFCLLEYAHSKGLPAYYYWHSGNDILSEGIVIETSQEFETAQTLQF